MIIYKKDLSEVNRKKFEELEKKCKKERLSWIKILLNIFLILTGIFFVFSYRVDGFIELGTFTGIVALIFFIIFLILFCVLKKREYVLVEGNMLRDKYLSYDKKTKTSYLPMLVDDERLYLFGFFYLKDDFQTFGNEDFEKGLKKFRSNQYKIFLVDLKKKYVIFDMTDILKI